MDSFCLGPMPLGWTRSKIDQKFRVTFVSLVPIHGEPTTRRFDAASTEAPMKFAKYALLALALLIPAVAVAATTADDCNCPCCPPKGNK